ncbi:hypothetical protein BpHYR1_002744 [Brachionus plicatilis]|uniref:Uncharacterized protein n=1 Tax=Brachionus plicatilis TaxID=10195 RepID=A0A3M7PL15_BRAPC|nr:hypothetical protein BpHYR1_002744 [Brachionus plicatilis]
MSETLSKESALEDPANQTLEDFDQDWTDVLKPANEIRKRGKAITYDLFKSFEDFDVILKEINDGKINGNTWIFKSQDGDKHRFYCKYLKHGRRAALNLQLTDGSKDDEHTNHPNDEEDIRKIYPIIYQKIVEYENFGQKPEAIITNLIKAGMQPPKKTKINLYILKAKKVSNQPTMNDLKEWCDQYNEIPEHDDQVFRAEYEYQAFPEQKFHKRVNCWAHVIRNSDKRLNHFVLPIKKEIRQDIKTIQKLFREDLFVYATQLFQKKWQEKKSQSINEFIDYFFSEWIDKNNGWYVEGICFPSTSNGIESSHDKI